MTLKVKRSSSDPNLPGVLEEISQDQLSEAITGGALVWVDALRPDEDEVAVLRKLDLPPLILEDISQETQTVTLRHYGDHFYVVFYALSCSDQDIDHFPLSVYVSGQTVVTIRQRDIPALQGVEQSWRQDVSDIGQNTAITLLYSLLDAVVDSYFPVLDTTVDRIEAIEDRILRDLDDDIQRQIVTMRRSLLATRRILAAERESLVKVFHGEHPLITVAMLPYFQDIYDHVYRATEVLDSSRELLSSAMGSYTSRVSNELNDVVRRLTSWTIILMVMTLVAGIYGMNFHNMPELSWRFGYPYALGLMALLVGIMTVIFRRIRWL